MEINCFVCSKLKEQYNNLERIIYSPQIIKFIKLVLKKERENKS